VAQYEVRRGSEQFGPYDHETLFNYYREGRVVATDEVREVGAAHWQTMQQFSQPQGMTPQSMPPPGMPPQGMAPPTGQVAQPVHVQRMSLAGPILVTLFCCIPFGIVSIVYAAQVNSKASVGDVAGAEESRGKATMWMWLGFGLGLAGTIIYIVGVSASGSSPFD
jgi:hypothetical protein